MAVAQGRTDRRLGWLAVFSGLVLALAAQVAGPVGVPLFDGVVVQEPYRYLHPSGNQPGSPTSFTSTPGVTGGISPIFVGATTENPPQAQLIVQKGAFAVPAAATSLHVSITPIEPPALAPAGRSIAGNVYRFSVADQDGATLQVKPCDDCITLLLRGTDTIGEATLGRYDGTTWVAVETIHAGVGGTFQANPTVLGDVAVYTAALTTDGAGGPDLVLVAGAVALVLLVAGMGFLIFRVRPAPEDQPPPTAMTRVPSKRKPPRRPTGGGPNR